jgi:site-specific DNA recombinase
VQNAVTYLRSSKDRHDVSIDVQRAELLRMAADRGLQIVGEYTDVVESGKDEDRPGFQRLYDDLRTRGRSWDTILVMDTSRLSRRIAAAYWFEDKECKPQGVTVLYKNLPDMDAAERALIKAVFHGVDEWHSLVSKRKGLSGMRQNVQAGFRAGGRAPLGYQLAHEPTGAVRDGQPVTKSRLVIDPASAPAVAKYLQLRAAGETARNAKRQAGLDTPKTSLRHMEWNALTYAGCTVWNVHAERIGGKAIGGQRRRPRSEWVIKEDTHEALITRAEAEQLLRQAEITGAPFRDRAPTDYLLAGMLRATDGRKWQGCRESDARYYRLNRRIKAEKIERAVIGKVSADLRAGSFVQSLLAAARKMVNPDNEADELGRAWSSIEDLDRKIAKVTGMLAETDAQRPLMLQIEKWETEREKIRAGMVELETRLQQARLVANITARDIEKIVAELADNMASLDATELRDFLRTFIEQITLEPTTPVTLRISYKIPMITGDKVASPRGFEPLLPP